MLQNVGAKVLRRYRLRVLAGDHHCINAHRLVVRVVFDCDLGFAIGPEVRKGAVLADFGEALAELVRQENWRRHVVRVFVARITEHHALIARAAGVDAHRDVTRLLVDAGDDCAGVGVEAVERIVIADRGDHTANQRLKINVSLSGDLAGDDDQAGRRQRLASHTAVGIFFYAGVENRIGDLIGDLVRVTLGHRF